MTQNNQVNGVINKILFFASDLWLLFGVVLIGVRFMFLTLALKELPLGYSTMFISLTNVSILIVGKLLFKEELSRNKLIALFFILTGVVLINL